MAKSRPPKNSNVEITNFDQLNVFNICDKNNWVTDADATRPIIKLLNRLIPVNVKFKNYFSVFLNWVPEKQNLVRENQNRSEKSTRVLEKFSTRSNFADFDQNHFFILEKWKGEHCFSRMTRCFHHSKDGSLKFVVILVLWMRRILFAAIVSSLWTL